MQHPATLVTTSAPPTTSAATTIGPRATVTVVTDHHDLSLDSHDGRERGNEVCCWERERVR
jgi:hypothetical protein